MRGAIKTAVATDSYDSFLFQTVPITKSQRKKRNEMNNSSTYLCTNYRNEKKEKNNEIKLFLHTHAHTRKEKMHYHMDGSNQRKCFRDYHTRQARKRERQINHYIHSLYCFHWN